MSFKKATQLKDWIKNKYSAVIIATVVFAIAVILAFVTTQHTSNIFVSGDTAEPTDRNNEAVNSTLPLVDTGANSDNIIEDVMNGSLVGFPEVGIGDAFRRFFVSTTWEHTEGTDGHDVVVFTGMMNYHGKSVTARLKFNHTVGTALSDVQGYEFEIESVSFDDIVQDEFASILLLYSIVGEQPTRLCGDWRSEHTVYEFYPGGTGIMRTSSSADIVWMVYNGHLYVNAPSENTELKYELIGYDQSFFHEGFDSETRFTKYQPLESSQATPQQGEEGWIFLACPWFRVSTPPTWQGNEIFRAPSAPGEAEVFGDGIGDSIEIRIFDSPISDPQMVINEYPSLEIFQFDDGHLGYMLERPNGITWFRLDSLGISLSHGGNRTVFTDNEETILRIARSLQFNPDYN